MKIDGKMNRLIHKVSQARGSPPPQSAASPSDCPVLSERAVSLGAAPTNQVGFGFTATATSLSTSLSIYEDI